MMNLQFPHFTTNNAKVSKIETCLIDIKDHGHGTFVSENIECHSVRLAETEPGGSYDWHPAPRKQYVVTLTGTVEFIFGNGDALLVKPGDVFLANDLEGKGHKWKIIGETPWRRLYVHLDQPPTT